MINPRPVKIMRVGSSLCLVIRAGIARELGINRGDYFDLRIGDPDTMVARRLKVVDANNFEEARDKEIEILKNE